MARRSLLAPLLLLALPALAFAAEANRGKSVYTANCMACHGDKGDGNGPAAVALNPKPRNFAEAAFWEGKTDEAVKKLIKTGKTGTAMSPFPYLSDEDLNALVAYMRTFPPAK